MKNKKEYPTKEDIEKHTKQLVTGIRQYLREYDKKGIFLKNSFNSLFSDLVLEAHNEGYEFNDIEININKLLELLKENKNVK